jgi:uncharacterized membrane protein
VFENVPAPGDVIKIVNIMEEIAKQITLIISHAAEILSAVIVGLAIIKVLINYLIRIHPSNKKISKEEIRVHFGGSVAVALELLLGADVLATAVAPSWNDIGKLAAIAILRTALNYFLAKELKHMHTVTKPKQVAKLITDKQMVNSY